MFSKEAVKQFLKPDRRKFFYFLIIFAIFVPFLKPHQVLCKVGAPCPQSTIQSILTLFIFSNGVADKIDYISLFVGLVLSYLVSCFLISAWDKIRKKPAV